MIVDFKCKDTEQLWRTKQNRRFASISRVALRKLMMLDAADSIADLRVPPANRLESLKGDRKSQYSIRINDQFRVYFRFSEGNAEGVEIVDYH